MVYSFLVLLFVVAFLHASVGHGGASGYLGLMAVFGMDVLFMKSSALTLNLFVAGIAFYSYYKAGYFRWKLIYPFLITSVPMAYLGAMVTINPRAYKIILACCLLVAIGRILFSIPKSKQKDAQELNYSLALVIGAVLGFFSGMIGIGGGIILSPLLLLLNWASIKETAAASALFILLNSASGLSGLLIGGMEIRPDIFIWIIIALIGGFVGSYAGSFKMQSKVIGYTLCVVLLFASIKLFVL